MEEPMTGAQLLNELRMNLEASLEALPRESDERRSLIRDLDDRSLSSGRRRGVA